MLFLSPFPIMPNNSWHPGILQGLAEIALSAGGFPWLLGLFNIPFFLLPWHPIMSIYCILWHQKVCYDKIWYGIECIAFYHNYLFFFICLFTCLDLFLSWLLGWFSLTVSSLKRSALSYLLLQSAWDTVGAQSYHRMIKWTNEWKHLKAK